MSAEDGGGKTEVFSAALRMAAHRTFLAYIRTGMGAMSLGFVIARFSAFLWKSREKEKLPEPTLPLRLGLALTAFGVLINVVATVHHFQLMRAANRGEPFRHDKWSPDLFVGGGMALIGLAILADLFLSP